MMDGSRETPLPSVVSIVDDEPGNLNVMESSLSRAGYRVAIFPRGEMALAAAREDPPDLVLLDIRMPGLDGYEVCRRFKAEDRLRSIPVIFISALSAMEDIAAGFECGGVDYVTKPFREPEVLARVRTHIALRKAHDTLAEQYARLRAIERHRDTLVHMLVHDLRSPLQAVFGHLQMVEETSAPILSVEDLHSLRMAIHGTQLLGRMVSTMIDLSRMETEDIPLHRKSVSVREIFRSAGRQATGPSPHSCLTEHISEDCPPLWCDIDLSVRMVANLIANAVKYSPQGSEIQLGAAPDASGVRIWIRDRGPGIPAQYHKKIFEKFGVAEFSGGQRPPSTGLGLAFCKLAAEAQGGTIGVESEPGKGSTFWFTLPAATE